MSNPRSSARPASVAPRAVSAGMPGECSASCASCRARRSALSPSSVHSPPMRTSGWVAAARARNSSSLICRPPRAACRSYSTTPPSDNGPGANDSPASSSSSSSFWRSSAGRRTDAPANSSAGTAARRSATCASVSSTRPSSIRDSAGRMLAARPIRPGSIGVTCRGQLPPGSGGSCSTSSSGSSERRRFTTGATAPRSGATVRSAGCSTDRSIASWWLSGAVSCRGSRTAAASARIEARTNCSTADTALTVEGSSP